MKVTIQLPGDISAALEGQWDNVPRRSKRLKPSQTISTLANAQQSHWRQPLAPISY